MLIKLAKYNGKSPTLSCIRDDGSPTWVSYGNQGGFFPGHDLTHFAVETIMGYRHGFFGMIANGRDLSDFSSGDAKTFHPEASYAEFLAGFMTATESKVYKMSYEEMIEAINSKLLESSLPEIKISKEQLQAIRIKASELIAVWEALPEGEIMELNFVE